MKRIDFKKELKHLYHPPSKEIGMVEVPQMKFLMVDGQGDPNAVQQYQDSIEALFAVSYALKFMIKKKNAIDYGVMPLEGLWWTDDMAKFSMGNKDIWKWTSMIMQPEFISEDLCREAREQVRKKKELSALPKVKFENLTEGLSVQIMHIGPYSAEKPTVDKLHFFIKENGYTFNGKHHEIYLGDPRKSSPEKMKTVIRQPIQSTGQKYS